MADTAELKQKYLPTIGIECHVQLKTKTKLFAAVGNDAREAPANTLISHICTGMPGALPVLNEEAVHLAIKAGLALNATIEKFSKFERKHYFYPDLPKGYQISQYEQPIISSGFVEITLNEEKKRIGITRAHMEEDAGKSTHPAGSDYSLVDLNRAGTPLLEIVSEPDMHSPEEAKAYARELYLLMKYADVSEADLYYGNMRFDVNISVSDQNDVLGKRAEIKNLNSFRAVENAVRFEIERQIELREKGEQVVQETRGWDDTKQKTFSQRSKEEAQDYRYMPDPDIPPIVLSDEQIKDIQDSEMPTLPSQLRDELRSAGLETSVVETLLDQPEAGQFMLGVVAQRPEAAKVVASWLVGSLQAEVAAGKLKWSTAKLDVESFSKLAEMQQSGKISSTAAKDIALSVALDGGDPEAIAEQKDLLQVSDVAEIEKIVAKVLADNQKAAQDVKNGEMKAIGFLVGQVMKLSQGKANPGLAQKIIKKQLS